MAMDWQAFIRSRRSVRRFTDQPVAQETLERILETATLAPSAHNRQPWRFVVITSPEVKTELVEAMSVDFQRALLAEKLSQEDVDRKVARSQDKVKGAPVAVVLCLDPTVMDEYADPDRREGEYLLGVQSVAMAGSTLLLSAHAEGLGGVWVAAPLFVPGVVSEVLDLPLTWVAQGLLLLGYPAEAPEPRPRRPVEEVTKFV